MLHTWIAHLLRRVPPRPRSPAPRSDPAHSAEFDLRTVPEYPMVQRAPLPEALPAEQQRLAPLVLAQLRSAQDLVPMPVLARHLLVTLESSEEPSVNTLVSLLHQDPAVAAQILRAANSAAFLGHGRVQGLREAVMRVGPATARQVALSAAIDVLSETLARALPAALVGLCRRQGAHALTVAQAAGWLAALRGGDAERAYLAGLLHDLGKLAVLHALLRIPDGAALPEALIEGLMDQLHIEVGVAVAGRWRLPRFALRVLAEHHERPVPEDEPETHLVRLCSGLDEIRTDPRHRLGLSGGVLETAQLLGLGSEALRALVTQLREAAARTLVARRPSGVPAPPARRATPEPPRPRTGRPAGAADTLELLSTVGTSYDAAALRGRLGVPPTGGGR